MSINIIWIILLILVAVLTATVTSLLIIFIPKIRQDRSDQLDPIFSKTCNINNSECDKYICDPDINKCRVQPYRQCVDNKQCSSMAPFCIKKDANTNICSPTPQYTQEVLMGDATDGCLPGLTTSGLLTCQAPLYSSCNPKYSCFEGVCKNGTCLYADPLEECFDGFTVKSCNPQLYLTCQNNPDPTTLKHVCQHAKYGFNKPGSYCLLDSDCPNATTCIKDSVNSPYGVCNNKTNGLFEFCENSSQCLPSLTCDNNICKFFDITKITVLTDCPFLDTQPQYTNVEQGCSGSTYGVPCITSSTCQSNICSSNLGLVIFDAGQAWRGLYANSLNQLKPISINLTNSIKILVSPNMFQGLKSNVTYGLPPIVNTFNSSLYRDPNSTTLNMTPVQPHIDKSCYPVQTPGSSGYYQVYSDYFTFIINYESTNIQNSYIKILCNDPSFYPDNTPGEFPKTYFFTHEQLITDYFTNINNNVLSTSYKIYQTNFHRAARENYDSGLNTRALYFDDSIIPPPDTPSSNTDKFGITPFLSYPQDSPLFQYRSSVSLGETTEVYDLTTAQYDTNSPYFITNYSMPYYHFFFQPNSQQTVTYSDFKIINSTNNFITILATYCVNESSNIKIVHSTLTLYTAPYRPPTDTQIQYIIPASQVGISIFASNSQRVSYITAATPIQLKLIQIPLFPPDSTTDKLQIILSIYSFTALGPKNTALTNNYTSPPLPPTPPSPPSPPLPNNYMLPNIIPFSSYNIIDIPLTQRSIIQLNSNPSNLGREYLNQRQGTCTINKSTSTAYTDTNMLTDSFIYQSTQNVYLPYNFFRGQSYNNTSLNQTSIKNIYNNILSSTENLIDSDVKIIESRGHHDIVAISYLFASKRCLLSTYMLGNLRTISVYAQDILPSPVNNMFGLYMSPDPFEEAGEDYPAEETGLNNPNNNTNLDPSVNLGHDSLNLLNNTKTWIGPDDPKNTILKHRSRSVYSRSVFTVTGIPAACEKFIRFHTEITPNGEIQHYLMTTQANTLSNTTYDLVFIPIYRDNLSYIRILNNSNDNKPQYILSDKCPPDNQGIIIDHSTTKNLIELSCGRSGQKLGGVTYRARPYIYPEGLFSDWVSSPNNTFAPIINTILAYTNKTPNNSDALAFVKSLGNSPDTNNDQNIQMGNIYGENILDYFFNSKDNTKKVVNNLFPKYPRLPNFFLTTDIDNIIPSTESHQIGVLSNYRLNDQLTKTCGIEPILEVIQNETSSFPYSCPGITNSSNISTVTSNPVMFVQKQKSPTVYHFAIDRTELDIKVVTYYNIPLDKNYQGTVIGFIGAPIVLTNTCD